MILSPTKSAAAAVLAAVIFGGSTQTAALDLNQISSNFLVFTDTGKPLAARNLTEVALGDLALPDGRLVAMDPLMEPDRKPFSRTVTPGTYPVSSIRPIGDDHSPGLLVIRFSNAKVEHFELAVMDGQDPTSLKADEYFGIPVDAGLAAFANSAFAQAQARREQAEQKADRNYSNYYDDVLAPVLPGKRADEFVLHRPLTDGEGAAAISQAGYGDGFYPVFWGLDATGSPALAFIDFFVIADGDGGKKPD